MLTVLFKAERENCGRFYRITDPISTEKNDIGLSPVLSDAPPLNEMPKASLMREPIPMEKE